MATLEVITKQEVGSIDFNFEELEKELKLELKKYDIAVTVETIKEAKEQKAKLNNLKKALDDKRKEIKKEYCKPLVDFEEKTKTLTTMITEAYDKINVQVNSFEEKEKEEKKARIKEKFDGIEFSIEINFEKVWEERYGNKTVSEKSVIEDIQTKVNKIAQDLEFIDVFTRDLSDVEKTQVLDEYQATLDIGKAKYKSDYLISLHKKVEETKVVEEVAAPEIERVDHAQEMVQGYEEEMLERTFKVVATRERIIALGNYMNEHQIKFMKVEGK